MAFTQSQIPAYILPGMTAHVTLTAGGAGANYLRVWYTDAPPGSKVKGELDKTVNTRVLAWEGDSGDVFDFTPDKGGRYAIAVQEYTLLGGAAGGGYEGAPQSYPTETKVGAEQTGSLVVAEVLEQTIGTGSDSATLLVTVADSTIRSTSVAVHGIKTPDIVSPRTVRATTAMLDTGVVAAHAALADVAATTAIGDWPTILADLRTKLNAHMSSTTYHDTADSANLVADSYAIVSASVEGVRDALTEIALLLDRHMHNDDGTGTGPGATRYHYLATVNVPDWKNLPHIKGAADASGNIALAGAIWAAFEAHRIDTGVHKVSDTADALTALPKAHDVHRQFVAVAAALAPTAPAVMNPGVVSLVHGAGMRLRT